jgi:cytoplasmic iron level regulating protein YaaA (DUF328/UPF0246 family)
MHSLKKTTLPDFLCESEFLVNQIKNLSSQSLAKTMKLSETLAELNYQRFQTFKWPFTQKNAKPCVFAFQGGVYQALQANTLTESDIHYAQQHLRILSGLYGILKPLDLIQAYRLEMGIRFKEDLILNLYDFWKEKLIPLLSDELKKTKTPILINLASNEYWKVIDQSDHAFKVITPHFKEEKKGAYKTIGFFSKKARGLMSRFIIQNRLEKTDDLKHFNLNGYTFHPKMSDSKNFVFTRKNSVE